MAAVNFVTMQLNLQPYIEAALSDLHYLIREWVPEALLRARLHSDIVDAFALMTNEERAHDFHDAVPVVGASPRDYMPQILVAGGVTYIVGIQFRVGPPLVAFAELYGSSAPLNVACSLEPLLRECRERLGVFQPRSLRIHHPVGMPMSSVTSSASVVVDFVSYASPIKGIKSNPHFSLDTGWKLELPSRVYFYDAYRAAYGSYLLEHPQLRGVLEPEPVDVLEDLLAKGLLRTVVNAGGWQGIIAARPVIRYGMSGFSVVENCLATSARGQHVAAPMFCEFAAQLKGEDSAVILGSINPHNVPAIRTARRVGRAPVMQATFIEI